MTERIAPGQPCTNCGHGVYVQKVQEGKLGEGADRNVDTSKRFTKVYWVCANCGKNPRELWQKARLAGSEA
jgi:DNA-directed RNA polymerase subunit RPC12/RpoP